MGTQEEFSARFLEQEGIFRNKYHGIPGVAAAPSTPGSPSFRLSRDTGLRITQCPRK